MTLKQIDTKITSKQVNTKTTSKQVNTKLASQHNIVIKHAFGLADSVTVSVQEGDIFAFLRIFTFSHFLTASRRRSKRLHKLERLKAAEKERLGEKPPLAGMFWLIKVSLHHLTSPSGHFFGQRMM